MIDVARVIERKQQSLTLSPTELHTLVKAISDNRATDTQVAAFTQAVCQNGMSLEETTALTQAMSQSGSKLHWQVDGPVVDKHSTGGVGDYISLVLAPTLAACGVYIPMISGRGLAHTGGTVDKLESIPGYNCFPSLDEFQHCVSQNGLAIIAQSAQIAPVDKRIYTIRDATSTVVCVPLIVSSILSKKLAEGLDALVIDIKCGNGAFAQNEDFMVELKTQMHAVASILGLNLSCVTTSMNEPISYNVGNNLEVKEVIDFLNGSKRHPKALSLLERLGAELLISCSKADDHQHARLQLHTVLDNGSAAEHFAKMVSHLGGPTDLLQRPQVYLPDAKIIRPVYANQQGQISAFNMKRIGEVCRSLSTNSTNRQIISSYRTGISQMLSVGTQVDQYTPICLLHAESEMQWQEHAQILHQQGVVISTDKSGDDVEPQSLFNVELSI
ncbi:MAG: thymidine phosphorylase [Aestuariibacter sp.]